jgi:hypothetical protein
VKNVSWFAFVSVSVTWVTVAGSVTACTRRSGKSTDVTGHGTTVGAGSPVGS